MSPLDEKRVFCNSEEKSDMIAACDCIYSVTFFILHLGLLNGYKTSQQIIHPCGVRQCHIMFCGP